MGRASCGKGIALFLLALLSVGTASAVPLYLLEVQELEGTGEPLPGQMRDASARADYENLVNDYAGRFHADLFVTPGRETIVEQRFPFSATVFSSVGGRLIPQHAKSLATVFILKAVLDADSKLHLVFQQSGAANSGVDPESLDATIHLKSGWWTIAPMKDGNHPGFWKGFLIRLTSAN